MSPSPRPVVLVTGAAGGIGYEIVRALLEEHNAAVVATDINKGRLEQLVTAYPQRLKIVVGDVVDRETSEKSVSLAIQTFGKLDGVCLNAGVFGPCYRLDNSNIEQWSKAFHINCLSYLHTLKYAIPDLRKTKGRVTCATSGSAAAALFPGWGFYGMSKAAVAYLVTQLALEEPDITVVGVSPGLCDTPMVKKLANGAQEGQTAEDVEKYHKFIGNLDMITPETAGRAFANTVIKANKTISGLVADYDDERLPIDEAFKRKGGPYDYTKAVA